MSSQYDRPSAEMEGVDDDDEDLEWIENRVCMEEEEEDDDDVDDDDEDRVD